MEVYDKNLLELEKLQPKLSRKIRELEKEEEVNFNIIENHKGEYVLEVKNDKGDYVQYSSFFNPQAEAEEITNHLNYELNRGLILIIGIGLGYQLEEVMKHINEKSIILVIEKDIYLLKEVLKHRDLSSVIRSKKVRFLSGSLEEDEFKNEIYTYIRGMSFHILNMQPVILPVMDLNYIRYSTEVFNYVRNNKDTYFFAVGNDLDDTLIGMINRFKNLPHYIKNPGLREFKEKYGEVYKHKPAIIVASGPSLDKNIELLKEAKGKALILACDGSMKALGRRNIVPDAVGSVERILLTYKAFYEGRTFPDETVLTAPAVVREEIVNTFNNKTLSFFKDETYGRWFNILALDKGTVWSGASVSHMLFGLAHEFGCDPIILIGQDLAYSEKGVSHVNEAEVKKQVDLKKVEVYVKDAEGNDLPSTYIWEKFLKFYEEAVRSSDRRIIDATEGGAYIKGTELMTLREVVDNFCIRSIPSLRSLIDEIKVEDEFIAKALVNAYKKTYFEIKRFNLIRKRAKKALEKNKKCEEMLAKGIQEQSELDEIYDTIEFTEENIVKKIMKTPMLYMLFQYPILAASSKISRINSVEFTFETLKENLMIQQELLKIVELYCRKTMKVFYEGLTKLQNEIKVNNYTTEIDSVKVGWIEKHIQDDDLEVEEV